MTRRALITIVTLASLGGAEARTQEEGWKPLFNGKDLTGWETFLGKPYKTSDFPNLTRNDRGDFNEPLGLNRDPHQNFSVVEIDGRPALRISGEVFGGISTKEEFENYHFRAEFRWGRKKWAPRENMARDNGLLYHCTGPHGAGSGFWMQSAEMQIQEHDCGDFHSVAGVLADVEASPRDPAKPKGDLQFKRGAEKQSGVARRVLKAGDFEKPTGEWNIVEFICFGQTAIHVVNGKANLVLTGLRRKVDGQEVPLTKGKIQIQSEGAEIYWRNIEVRKIPEIPKQFLD